MTLHATYFGANGWLLEFEGLRVLVDPWLTGPLRFPPGDWFFRGELPHPWPVPEGLDLLLLTQGLPDHCHPASLSLLDRQLPVVGSSSAAARARALGFTRVTAVSPGQEHSHGPLQIQATAGAPVPQVENGYRLVHPAGSIYLEPHGFLATDPATAPRGPVDVAITPVVDLGLPLAGAFVKGAGGAAPAAGAAATGGGAGQHRRRRRALPGLAQPDPLAERLHRAGRRRRRRRDGERHDRERRELERLHGRDRPRALPAH